MIKITEKQFALICYNVLMANGKGLISKSIKYITDKHNIVDSGYFAFGVLDINNQCKVINYLKEWHIKIPEEIQKEYFLERGCKYE